MTTPATTHTDPDTVLADRHTTSGQWIAGLITAAELDTLARPDRLPADLFPDAPPELVQAIWDRALVVGIRAGKYMHAPRFHRDQLARHQQALTDIGHTAMAARITAALNLIQPTDDASTLNSAPGQDW